MLAALLGKHRVHQRYAWRSSLKWLCACMALLLVWLARTRLGNNSDVFIPLAGVDFTLHDFQTLPMWATSVASIANVAMCKRKMRASHPGRNRTLVIYHLGLPANDVSRDVVRACQLAS